MSLDSIIEAGVRGSTPPDRRPIYEWARENVKLVGSYAEPGFFDVNRSPWLIPIFDALQNRRVRQVVVRKCVRGGGTLVFDVWLPWVVANDPGPLMYISATDKLAKRQAERRNLPTLKACKLVAPLLPSGMDRNKLRTQEIIFNNGMVISLDGPALSNLQQVGIRYAVTDESWMPEFREGRMEQIEARLGDFKILGIDKALHISQAGAPGDHFDRRYMMGTQEELHAPCESCGKPMKLSVFGRREDGSRFGLMWGNGNAKPDGPDEYRLENGNWNIKKARRNVWYECGHCGHHHLDGPTKERWKQTCYYIPANPDADLAYRSFTFSAIVRYPWSELAGMWMAAMDAKRAGNIQPMIDFIQKYPAEPTDERKIVEDEITLQIGQYDVKSDWPDEKARFMTVDVQKDHFWVLIIAWSGTECRRLWAGKCMTEGEIIDLIREYKIKPWHGGIDMRYVREESYVKKLCVKLSFFGLIGEAVYSFSIYRPIPGTSQQQKTLRSYTDLEQADPEFGQGPNQGLTTKYFRWAHLALKPTALHWLENGKFVVNIGALPPEMEKEFKEQMASERPQRVWNKRLARYTEEWLCPSRNNHLWDCYCMQFALAISSLIMGDPANVMSQPEPEPEPTK